MIRTINKLTAPLARRVRLMVGRGVVSLVKDSLKMQGLQVTLLSGEVRDLERFQDYGFTSVPHPGAEVAAVFVDGNRNHGLAICVDDRRYRLARLKNGEVAIYTDEGDKIVLKRGGIVEMTASQKVRMVTPLLEVTGEIKDLCDGTGRAMSGMRQMYNNHDHNDPQGGVVGTANQKM